MLNNAYFIAKIGFDTVENEPAKNVQKNVNICKKQFVADYYYAARWSRFQVLLSDLGALLTPRARAALAAWREPRGSGGASSRHEISARCCSFSAGWAPIFASKYAFFSIMPLFKNLQDYFTEILK